MKYVSGETEPKEEAKEPAMETMNFILIDHTQPPYVKFVNYANALEKRVFAPKGKEWPIVCLSTYPSPSNLCQHAIRFEVSYKLTPEAWWEQYPLPKQLIPHAIEMLQNRNKE